jgi:hypothetical protein
MAVQASSSACGLAILFAAGLSLASMLFSFLYTGGTPREKRKARK